MTRLVLATPLLAFPLAAVLALVPAPATEAGPGLPPIGWSRGPSFPTSFIPRWDVAYGYFPPTDEVVLFGGAPKRHGEPWRNGTWLFDGGSWRQGPAAPPGLTPRGGAAMAYHPGIGKMVMFGGAGSQWPPYRETWLWDGTGWSRGPAAPAGLAGRTGHQMAYFPEIGKVVLFGGSGVLPYADTWLFDGTAWLQGPPAPPGMSPRVFFGMAYDPGVGKVLVAGGNGGTDSWYFDGAGWAPGPALAPGARERFRMEYDPQLGGIVMFGGIGPGPAKSDLWVLQGSSWRWIYKVSTTAPWPEGARVDGALVWFPSKDALLLFAGLSPDDAGTTGFSDTWFFRDVAPRVASVAVSPTAPHRGNSISMTKGPTLDGYRDWYYQYEWLKNGQRIAGASGQKLTPQVGRYVHGDVIVARVRVSDHIGLVGPWTESAPVTVVNRPPSVKGVSMRPATVYTSAPASVAATTSDPDGDPVTLHYVWKVNGVALADSDSSILPPDRFKAGDVLDVVVTPVDSEGLSGEAKRPDFQKTVQWHIDPRVAAPGDSKLLVGKGFGAGETVDLVLDSPSGTPFAAAAADPSGSFEATVTVPSPLRGGEHIVYGVGRTSGIVGPGPLTVLPGASLSPWKLRAGQSTVFAGAGYQPGETVTISFPHGDPVRRVADPDGSVRAALASPAEPFGTGFVTGSAPSGSAQNSFTSLPSFDAVPLGRSADPVRLSATGYGASEIVELELDGSVIGRYDTDSTGSLSRDVQIVTTFGSHVLTLTGLTTGVRKSEDIFFPSWLDVTPDRGPVGTVVSITSGPGWVPGSSVRLDWKSGQVGTVTADGSGVVRTTFQIPQSITGTFALKLTDDLLGKTAKHEFTVTAGSLPGSRRLR